MRSRFGHIAFLVTALGCSGDSPEPVTEDSPKQEVNEQVASDEGAPTIIQLTGFDSKGEPEIRLEDDGSMYVVFNFMPPSWVDDSERVDFGSFANFDKEMERAIGVPVLWDDREFFYIESPKPDTVQKIRDFVQDYRTNRTGKTQSLNR